MLVSDEGAPRTALVQQREVAAGVAEVFDLTVQHELHNFVAAGLLVHNKSPAIGIRNCPVSQPRGTVTLQEIDACELPDGGVGHVVCPAKEEPGSCAPNDP